MFTCWTIKPTNLLFLQVFICAQVNSRYTYSRTPGGNTCIMGTVFLLSLCRTVSLVCACTNTHYTSQHASTHTYTHTQTKTHTHARTKHTIRPSAWQQKYISEVTTYTYNTRPLNQLCRTVGGGSLLKDNSWFTYNQYIWQTQNKRQ